MMHGTMNAPDNERYYRSKYIEQPGNKEIINYATQLHRVGYFIKILFDAWNHECS
jgi:hypothetical protein